MKTAMKTCVVLLLVALATTESLLGKVQNDEPVKNLITVNPADTADIPDEYSDGGNITLIPNILNLGYSPDQKLLVVLETDASGFFYTFNGFRYNGKQTVTI